MDNKELTTYEFYEKNWKDYGNKTVNIIPYSFIKSFLRLIPDKKDLILELGSGSGNCLKHIQEEGFNICGSDYIIDIVLNLKQKVDCCSYVIDFSDIEFLNSFIGNTTVKHVFANAALQHLDVSSLLNLLRNINIEGFLGFNLKEGSGEILLEDGRKEMRYQKRQIERILNEKYDIVYFEKTDDLMGRNFSWLNWITQIKK